MRLMPLSTQSLPRQGTLPFKRKSAGQTVTVPESAVETSVDYQLRADGATVLSTVVRYKLQTCPRCSHRFRPKGGYGTTPGVPDRLARHSDWPQGLWLGLELKGSKTRLSPEQKLLLADGAIYVCRSGEEAREALLLADQAFVIARQELIEIAYDLNAALGARSMRDARQASQRLSAFLKGETNTFGKPSEKS